MNLELLQQAVMDSRDGITISDNSKPDNPLIFVNPAFERMTGYSFDEITRVNCRVLQRNDRDQPAIAVVHRAIERGEYCLATLRNYRKDGTMFWNELSISPIFDHDGAVTHFIGIQKNVTTRVLLEQQLQAKNQSFEQIRSQLEQLAVMDGLTGIYNRRFFDAQLDIQWKIAQRNNDPLTLIMLDIDNFKQFNDSYGHQAGDDALKAVAGALSRSFSRASDFVARYGGEEFVVLAIGMTMSRAAHFAESLCQQVRDLRIPHGASGTGYLTVSAGYAVHMFAAHEGPAVLLADADRALYLAKQQGRNQAIGA